MSKTNGNKGEVILNIELDDKNMPVGIDWNASGYTDDKNREAKSFLLSIWDKKEQSTLRVDLWTQDMKQDEMHFFFFQSFMTMADTFERATKDPELTGLIREFGKNFAEKSQYIKTEKGHS